MVDITIVNGGYNGYKPNYNWGGPSCKSTVMIFTGPFKADIAGMLLLGCCTSARIAMVIMVSRLSHSN